MPAAQRAPVAAQPDPPVAGRAFDTPAPYDPSIWRIIFSRLVELIREFPRIVRGLSKLWPPFRRQMLTILAMNTGIAAWETTLTVAVAWQLNALAAKWSYIELLGLFTLTLVVFHGLHEAVFPFVRERYVLKNFKVDFPMHVAMTCIRSSTDGKVTNFPVAKRTPVIQAGCPAAYTLTEMMLRDPAFAIRGLIIMGVFWFTDPLLMAIGTLGMLLDFVIVLYMDARIYELNERWQQSENALWGNIIHTLDAESSSGRAPSSTERLVGRCEGAWREFKDASVKLGMKKLILNEGVRNPISLAIRWGTMLIIAWSVTRGDIQVGSFLMYVGLIGNAAAPFRILYAFQQQVMDTRPALRRLGELCGIDFGITAPKLMKRHAPRSGSRVSSVLPAPQDNS